MNLSVVLRGVLTGTILILLNSAAHAQELDFDQWLKNLYQDALAQNISASTLDAALTGLQPIPRVIELDRKQPELTLTVEQYLSRVVPPRRVDAGRRKLAQNRSVLKEIGRKFGVQPRFIVALWGIETDFGRLTGGFPAVQALATLAYDGRRSAFFRKELLNALHILDQGHIGVEAMTGSWAGALGQCQFMPSSFKRFAVDYNGDGREDIWNTLPDVFASAANYLARSGWDDSQTWGREVRLPKGFDRKLIGLETRKRLSQWQALGVRRANGRSLPKRDLKASIIQPDGKNSRAFVVYDNYRVILKWNRSDSFALAVGQLSDRIAGRGI
jgi:membrane-bound lytic murein transglycosylase B